jgi:hypothetical protein
LVLVSGLFLQPPKCWSAPCDSILIDEGLKNSSLDVQAAAAQLVLTPEQFEQLKTQFPGVTIDQSQLGKMYSFVEFSEARAQAAKRYVFAYGLDSARAILINSLGLAMLEQWSACMRITARSPGLYGWISKLTPQNAEISITWLAVDGISANVSARSVGSDKLPNSFVLRSGESNSFLIQRPQGRDLAILISADGTYATVVVPNIAASSTQIVVDAVQMERVVKRGESIFLQSLGGNTRSSVNCLEPDDKWVFDVDSARVIISGKGDNVSGAGASLASIVVRTPQRICFELLVRPSLAEAAAYISAYLEVVETRPKVGKTFQACVGEPAGGCQAGGDNLGCDVSIDKWAQQKCSSAFSTKRISSVAGGRCGYSVYQIVCSPAN